MTMINLGRCPIEGFFRGRVGMSTYRAQSAIFFTDLGGNAVLLDARKGLYHGLDPVGAVIWQAIVKERFSLSDIVQHVLRKYPDASPDQVSSDVSAFLSILVGKGLVEHGEP